MDYQNKIVKSFVLTAITLGFVVVQLDVTVVNVATKTIAASIGGSVSGLQWVVNAYTLTFAAFILTAGTLGDRIGAKRIFITGFAIFTVASLGCGLSPNLFFLIASRSVQGIGAAILVPCSLTLLNHTYTKEHERLRAVGIWAAGASTALALGVIVGGGLIALLGWRSIFFINLPIGILGIWLSVKYISETPRSANRSLDFRGQLTVIISLILLAASLIEGGKIGWTNLFVLGGFILFAIILIAFILIELKASSPMLPPSFFKIKTFRGAALVGLLINISFYGLIFILSFYFQQSRNYSPLKTGFCFLPMICAVFISNLWAQRLAKIAGEKKIIIIGEIIFLAGCLLLSKINAATDFLFIAPQFIAIGFGVGLVVPPMTSVMLGSVDKSRSGLASGILNSMRQTGSVIGVALFGSLITNRKTFLHGLHVSLIISSALLLLSIMAALTISQKKKMQPQ